jgi:hypothetical protein
MQESHRFSLGVGITREPDLPPDLQAEGKTGLEVMAGRGGGEGGGTLAG